MLRSAGRKTRNSTSAQCDSRGCVRAADIFCALGDEARLRLLLVLMDGELCVTDIAETLGDNLAAVSQRLKLLRTHRIVAHRRDGKRVFYRLNDEHVAQLIANALAHARETDA